MALDMEKYRRIFLEESIDHLGEVGRALLDLEKEMANVEAIDTIFRMAHSMKSMAASLGYEPVADMAHRLEDRMEGVRAAGCVRDHEELALLFRGLEALEAMVAEVNADADPTPAEPSLIVELSSPHIPVTKNDTLAKEPSVPDRVGGEPKKV